MRVSEEAEKLLVLLKELETAGLIEDGRDTVLVTGGYDGEPLEVWVKPIITYEGNNYLHFLSNLL